MIVYHMSDTLPLGAALTPDYKRSADLTAPFVKALTRSDDCFFAALYAARHMNEVLDRFGLSGMPTDEGKWAVEAVFEHVRQTAFPDRPSRLRSGYFFDRLDDCRTLYEVDWGRASAEERSKIHLFEVELDDERPFRLDMRLFDAAYDDFWEREDLDAARELARRYFAGEASANPVWELVSEGRAVAVRDVTPLLARGG